MVLSWPRLPLNPFTGQLENLYGFLGLIGVVSLAIIGMLYKIVPFLVWFGSLQPANRPCPSSRAGGFVFCTAAGHRLLELPRPGLLVTGVAILFSNEPGVRCGCSLLALSIATLAANVGAMLSHFQTAASNPSVFRQPPSQKSHEHSST